MKYRIHEDKLLLVITSLIGLYDFLYLPIKTFLTTLVFVVVIYYLTQDIFFVAVILLVPNFINLINKLLGNKERFTNPTEVIDRIQSIKGKEPFVNAVEVSKRVEEVKKEHTLPKVDIEHTTYDNELGMYVSENSRIQTRTEDTIPKVGTVEKNPLENPYVRNFDDESIGVALSRTTNNNAVNAGDINGVEI